MLLSKCICGCTRSSSYAINDIPIAKCDDCGIIRQKLNYTKEQYFDYYKKDYHNSTQEKLNMPIMQERYEHDKRLAEERLTKYKKFLLNQNSAMGTVLDIGSSNNAFVDLMNENGHQAFGIEIGEEGKKNPLTTFTQDLFDINFPTKHFGFVTLHDVIEHLINPLDYIKELRRIIKEGGTLVIDLPNFYVPEGKHHWRPVQHLWFFTLEQMKNLLNKNGFRVAKVDNPIPSKIVIYATRTTDVKFDSDPKKILLMAGMGDCYWALTKLQDFIKKQNFKVPPKVYVAEWGRSRYITNKPRAEDFLRLVPFIEYSGPMVFDRVPEFFEKFYVEELTSGKKYRHPLQWCVTDYVHKEHHIDYCFNFNGALEMGESLDSGAYGLDKLESNWEIPLFESLEEKQKQMYYKEKFGEYNVGYFNDLKMYKQCTDVMTPEVLYKLFRKIYNSSGRKTVLIGVTWDAEYQKKIKQLDKDNIIHYEVGNTTTEELFALFKSSKMVIGWASGSTIMATRFNIPTIMFHPDLLLKHKDGAFKWNIVNPETHNKTYFPFSPSEFNVEKILEISNEIK